MSHIPGRLRFEHDAVASFADHRADGRAARSRTPRSVHAEFVADPGRDPLGIIERQNADRLPDLVPLRMSRMAESPFAFYRGTAAIQAADLAGSPDSGRLVVACGDAHLTNFGIFAAPDRSLVFDLNDFDEAAIAPWEWDVKRLVTSVVIAADDNGFDAADAEAAALAATASYRITMRALAKRTALERYYQRSVATELPGMSASSVKALNRTLKRAAKRTSSRVAAKIMETAPDGTQQIREQPPTLLHVESELEDRLGDLVAAYRRSASPDIALLLAQYTPTDVARRVVGVGSVGTRCTIAVFTGPHGEPLILQMKEAGRSVLDEYGELDRRPGRGITALDAPADGGERVVTFQRVLQSSSDAFLGHLQFGGRGFYVRQFRDFNASIEVSELDPPAFLDYVRACGHQLARAHAQSPGAGFIAGYLGSNDVFDRALTSWAQQYAARSLADYRAFVASIDAGRFETAPPQ